MKNILFLLILSSFIAMNALAKMEVTISGEKMDTFNLLWHPKMTGEIRNNKEITIFIYASQDGLRDLDFHPIRSDKDWQSMKSKNSNSVALVKISPKLSISELQKCTKELSDKGNYQAILVEVE